LAEIATQRPHGSEIAAGSAAETEINAAGVESGKSPELLGHNERRVIGQHDAAAAHADGTGCAGYMPDENGRGGTGEAIDRMMLRQPETLVPPLLYVLRQIDGTRDGRAGSFARLHAYEIEYRNGQTICHGD
jgi:hypothetical protein